MNKNGRKLNTKGFGDIASPSPEIVCPRCNGAGTILAECVTIGDRLRACREKKNETQATVAKALKTSRAQVANLEANRGRPGLETIVNAANYYAVSVDWLLGRATCD